MYSKKKVILSIKESFVNNFYAIFNKMANVQFTN